MHSKEEVHHRHTMQRKGARERGKAGAGVVAEKVQTQAQVLRRRGAGHRGSVETGLHSKEEVHLGSATQRKGERGERKAERE
jgi:hypothetical protein